MIPLSLVLFCYQLRLCGLVDVNIVWLIVQGTRLGFSASHLLAVV